jgi:hypothetical protein
MSNSLPPIQISLTPRFQKDINQLAKRYRSIRIREQGTVNKLVCTSLDWETLYRCLRFL